MTIQPKFEPIHPDTGPAEGRDEQIDILNLEEILRMVWRRRLIIIASVAACLIVTALMLSRMTPMYVAGGQLLLGQQGRSSANITDFVSGISYNDRIVEGELAVLQSSRLLGRVVEKLKLYEDPEFNARLVEPSLFETMTDWVKGTIKSFFRAPPPNAASNNEALAEAARAQRELTGKHGAVIAALSSRMRTRQVGQSFVVSVGITSPDPRKAAGIANTILDEYIEYKLALKFASVERVSSWLNQRLTALEEDVQASENQVLDFRATISSAESAERLEQQVSELTSRLVGARAELAEAEARYQQIKQIVDTQSAVSASDVLTSPLLSSYRSDLARLRLEERQIISRFGPDDVKLATIRASIEALDAEIEREVGRLLQEQSNLVDIARAGVASLSSSLADLEDLALQRSKDQVKLRQLDRLAEAERISYEELLTQFKEARDVQGLQEADAEVISYAAAPSQPSSPKIKVSMVLAGAAGLFFGLGLTFLLEIRRNGFTSADELRKRTALPVLATFSDTAEKTVRWSLQATRPAVFNAGGDPTNARLANEARGLRSFLQFGFDERVQTILVTSSVQNEGKTTTSRLLGWASSQSGKSCLLIDADMSQPSLSHAWRSDGKPDLVAVLSGEAEVDAAVRYDEGTGCYVLPTTQVLEDHAALLDPKTISDVMMKLRDSFDLVIIDSPPLLALSDALAFSRVADLTLFAVRWRRTPAPSVLRALRLLTAVNMRRIGLLMTFVDRKSEKDYQYRGYTDGYGKYGEQAAV